MRERTKASAVAEDDEHRQPLDEPVREPEGEADAEERGNRPERLEHREAEPAEGELLDDRRDRGEDDEVDDERAARE